MSDSAIQRRGARIEVAPDGAMTGASLTRNRRVLVTIGVMLALLLAALDATVVGTALPRIVADLHGLSEFAWVVTAYLVAETAMTPIADDGNDNMHAAPPRRADQGGGIHLAVEG
jgi:putative Ca2+/H+ antiporter (TMEM165/GDT1 family)